MKSKAERERERHRSSKKKKKKKERKKKKSDAIFRAVPLQFLPRRCVSFLRYVSDDAIQSAGSPPGARFVVHGRA